MTPTKPEPMSVKMETVLVVKVAGCTHRLTLQKARDLQSMLAKFLTGNSEAEGAQRVRDVQQITIEHFGLNTDTFLSAARHEAYTWPRFIAMAIAREVAPRLTLTQIGNEFGRDHGTVVYGIKEVTSRIATYPEKRADVDAIRAKLNGGGQ